MKEVTDRDQIRLLEHQLRNVIADNDSLVRAVNRLNDEASEMRAKLDRYEALLNKNVGGVDE